MAEVAELYEMLEGVCPRFKHVPESEKEVISRHMAGLAPDVIAQATGRTAKSVGDSIDRYSSLVSRVPDAMRMQLARAMLVSSISSYAAAASDRSKIDALGASDAIKTLRDMQRLLPEIMEMEVKLLEHEKTVRALNYDGFAKSLGAGKQQKGETA